MDTLLLSALLALGIQAVLFPVAFALGTDKLTDLSYSMTFLIIAVLLMYLQGANLTHLLLVLMVVLWGLRLGGYLFLRVLRMGKDARFDGIREHPWRFARFWLLQGIVVWVVMLPVMVAFRTSGPHPSAIFWAGAVIWAFGLGIESVADWQKDAYKRRHPGTLTTVGLWRYSRHPNYFGEMLVWWGVFIATIPSLHGAGYLSVIGPVCITLLLRYVTGVPTVEPSQAKRYGKEYAQYRKRTRLLVPLP